MVLYAEPTISAMVARRGVGSEGTSTVTPVEAA